MSQLAHLYLMDTAKLQGLVQSDFDTYLAENAREVYPTDAWKEPNGYIFGTIIVYLMSIGIDLSKSGFDDISDAVTKNTGSTTLILTVEHKHAINQEPQLHNISLEDSLKINLEFSGDETEEIARDFIYAIEKLRENLSLLEDESKVLLLVIG